MTTETITKEKLPSLEPPDNDDELHIIRDAMYTLCGRQRESGPLHHQRCNGEIVKHNNRLYCNGCQKFLCATCLDILRTWENTGVLP